MPSERLSDEYFSDIADNLPVVLALTNAGLAQFLYVNRAYEAIWGRTVDSLYADSMSFVRAVHSEDQPSLRMALAGLIQGKPIDSLECRVLRPDGTMCWVLCRGFPVRDASGDIVRLVGTAQDITERKKIETQLRESEELYRDLVEHSSDLICTHDSAGILLSVNEPPLKILGYSREELLGRPLRDFLTPETRPLCDAYLAQVLKVGVASGLLAVLTKKGEVRLWEYNNSVRQDVTGPPIVRGLAHDVTDQKRAEKALRKSEEMFSKAFHASPVEMFITNLETGRFLHVNETFEKSVGVSRDWLIGRTSLELNIWANPSERQAFLDEIRRNGRVIKREIQLRMKSGEPAFKLFSAEPIRLGEEQCLLVVSEDITDRKKAHSKIEELSSRLLHLHDEERRNIARDLHDSTGQDLVALSAFLAEMQEHIPVSNRKARKTLAQATAVAERCIREVRTLSYLLYPPMLEETGLKDALSHFIKGYAKRSTIQVQLEISAQFGRLHRDLELTLFRVVQESLTNIQRHSGSQVAKISLHRTPEAVSFQIADRGRGIAGFDQDHRPPYFMVYGVGLSSMAERVKRVGGQFEIDSSSCGTVIRGAIPLNEKKG